MKNHNKAIALIMLVVAIAAIIALNVGCNGCNKPRKVEPSVVQVIEQAHNPAIETLKKENAALLDSVKHLNERLKQQKTETAISERKATQTTNRLKAALDKKDTAEIIVYADDAIEECNAYIRETVKQDSIQESIIQAQAAVIENTRAELELHESKFNSLKQAYETQERALIETAKQKAKLEKKLKRAKFWNKVLGIGTAAGGALAALTFL